jgi:cytochrome c oxidase subunit 2
MNPDTTAYRDGENFQLPPAMAVEAKGIDDLYLFLFWFSVAFFVAIVVASLWFIYKYPRRKGAHGEAPLHITKLEIFWTVVPFIFIIFLFHLGFKPYIQNAIAAEGATDIRVRASQWRWEFEYPDGSRDTTLHLVVNQPYRMVISSEDVIHAFYIPEFRMKKDAIPGSYSQVAFTANVEGWAHVFCAEYCGAPTTPPGKLEPGSITAPWNGHAGMLTMVKVEKKEEFDKYLEKLSGPGEDPVTHLPETPEKWGARLFVKNGCTACHTTDGSWKGLGPDFKGLFGRDEEMADGSHVTIDDNYIVESITKPNAKKVKTTPKAKSGNPAANYEKTDMPPFVMKEKQMSALITYLKSLK